MISQKVYYKLPGMVRACRGVVIGGNDDDGWQVQGCRRANCFKGEVFTVASCYLQTVDDFVGAKEKKRRVATPVDSVQRAQIAMERFPLSELEVLRHPVVVGRMLRDLAHLASSNGISPKYALTGGMIDNQDFDGMELYSEYSLQLLQTFRREAANAPDSDLLEFHNYLGVLTNTSRISITIHREAKTKAIRYLKKRQAAHCRMSGDVSDNLEAPAGMIPEWLRLKTDIARAMWELRAKHRTAAKVVMIKFALGRETVWRSNQGVAEIMRQATGQTWNAGKVAYTLTAGLGYIREVMAC